MVETETEVDEYCEHGKWMLNIKLFNKVTKWTGIVLGMLILVLIVLRIIPDVVFGMQLRNTLRELKTQGVPLTVTEIAPPLVQDADNAAMLMKEAAERVPVLTNTTSSALINLAAIIEPNTSQEKVCTDITIWTESQREEGAKQIKSDEVKEWYALLEKAAQRHQYNNNLDYKQGLDMLLPNYGKYRTMIRILAVKAGFEAQSGDYDHALKTILTGLKLNNKLSEEPTLVTQLVRIHCDIIMIDELERLTNASAFPAEPIQALMAELSLHTDIKPWSKALDAGRVCMGLWIYDKIIRTSVNKSSHPSLEPDSSDQALKWIIPSARPIIKKDFIVYLKLMSKIQRYYEQPYYQIADTLQQEPIEKQIPRYAVLSRLLLSDRDKITVQIAKHLAVVEICRVGLALKVFNQKSGVYPETLDKLVPEFLKSVPVDPFTGKPLVYRKGGDGFLLYSLGPNRKDDGGKPPVFSNEFSSLDDSDIVYGK